MELKTFKEEQEHICTVEEALELADKLFSLIVVADVFCSQVCDCENGASVRYLVNYLRKVADSLYYELAQMTDG